MTVKVDPEKVVECLDSLADFWSKYTKLLTNDQTIPDIPIDIRMTEYDLKNIQNRILALLVKKDNPELFGE